MAKIKLKDGTEIDSEKVYDYSGGADDFEENFKDNQKWWSESPDEAHSSQERNVGALDKETGGKSRYTPSTGSWELSDGRRSTKNGIEGNSYLSPYFDRKKTEGYKRSEDAREKYFSNTFSYDPEKDEQYRRYKERYIEGGQMASDDAIARSAMRTGGMASSYATTAGALAYRDYMKGLEDKIPELSALAYQKWEDEQARLREEAEYGEDMTEREYSDWAAGRSAYLDKKNSEEAQRQAEQDSIDSYNSKLLKYEIAIDKARSEGFGALSDEEREAIYSFGGHYDPEWNEIVDASGNAYSAGINKKSAAADSRISAILYKAQNSKNGAASLSVSELTDLMDSGYSVSGNSIVAPQSTDNGTAGSGRNRMDNVGILSGMIDAVTGKAGKEAQLKAIEDYFESEHIPNDERSKYFNMFVNMFS